MTDSRAHPSPRPDPVTAQDGDPPSASDVCLEARMAAADPAPLRAAVEGWLRRHESSPARLDDEPCEVRYSGDATFYMRPAAEGGLSVFLHASGADALRTLAWHSSDLLCRLVGNDVAVTWVRHPQERERNRIRFG